jgi:hypothetical protein
LKASWHSGRSRKRPETHGNIDDLIIARRRSEGPSHTFRISVGAGWLVITRPAVSSFFKELLPAKIDPFVEYFLIVIET